MYALSTDFEILFSLLDVYWKNLAYFDWQFSIFCLSVHGKRNIFSVGLLWLHFV